MLKKFFLILKGLSDESVVSLTEKEYDLPAYFFSIMMKSFVLISDEQFNSNSFLLGILAIKKWVVLSRIFFGNWYLASHRSLGYKYILSISGYLFTKFNNAFVFSDPEPSIISILYGWSGIYGQFELSSNLFSLT